MIRVEPDKEKLFKAMSRGHAGALTELLESERAGLYDYLLRMTGQVSRAFETTDEVFQSLTGETLATLEAYPDLKVCLYMTARRFNADIWNADTARLVNDAVDERQPPGALDRALRVLPGPERETVLLYGRGGFDAAESGEIMGLDEAEAETRRSTGLRRLAAECGAFAPPGKSPATWLAEELLPALPDHPLPPRSSQATTNLSMVMQGIQTRPVGLRSPLRLAVLGVVVAAVAVCLFFPDLLQRAVDSLRGGHAASTSSPAATGVGASAPAASSAAPAAPSAARPVPSLPPPATARPAPAVPPASPGATTP